jgi:hypothetical protein
MPTLDDYILDTLMPDLVGDTRHPSAFIVYLFLWRHTQGERGRTTTLSLRTISEGTGLSKRAVQEAIARLARRQLVTVDRASITATPRYTVHRPWARSRKT